MFLLIVAPTEVKVQTVWSPRALLQDQPLQLDVPTVEFHHTVVLTEGADLTVLFQLDQLRDLQALQPHVLSEAFHHTAALMEAKVPTALYLQDRHQVQQLLLDAPMVVFHHTAAQMVVKGQTVSYLLGHQRDQLKATNIYLLALMAELDQTARLEPHNQPVLRPHLLVVLTVETLRTAALTEAKDRTALSQHNHHVRLHPLVVRTEAYHPIVVLMEAKDQTV